MVSSALQMYSVFSWQFLIWTLTIKLMIKYFASAVLIHSPLPKLKPKTRIVLFATNCKKCIFSAWVEYFWNERQRVSKNDTTAEKITFCKELQTTFYAIPRKSSEMHELSIFSTKMWSCQRSVEKTFFDTLCRKNLLFVTPCNTEKTGFS